MFKFYFNNTQLCKNILQNYTKITKIIHILQYSFNSIT